MPAPFPSTNMTTIVDLFQYANTVTGEGKLFGMAMVTILWLASWANFEGRYDNKGLKAVIASSFITFLFACILAIANLIPQIAFVLPLLVLLISLVADQLFAER